MSDLVFATSKKNKTNTKYLGASLSTLDNLKADTLVIGVCEDIRPLKGAAGYIDWRMCGEISNLIRNQSFSGEPGEILLMSGRGRLAPVRLILMGWGPANDLENAINPRCSQLISLVERAASKKVAVALPEPVAPSSTPVSLFFPWDSKSVLLAYSNLRDSFN